MEDLVLNDYLKIAGLIFTIVGAVITIKKFLDYLNDKEIQKLNKMSLEDVTPNRILEEFNNTTPYQRKKFESSYKGLKVKWNVQYYAVAETFRRGRVGMVMSFSDKRKFQYVNFKTNFNKFPIIKSAKEGDKFYVTGLVDSVSNGNVYLKLIDIEKDKFFIF